MRRALYILALLAAMNSNAQMSAWYGRAAYAATTTSAPPANTNAPPYTTGLAFYLDARDYASFNGYRITNATDRSGINSVTNIYDNQGALATNYGGYASLKLNSADSLIGYRLSPGVPCTNKVLVVQVHNRTTSGRNASLAYSGANGQYAFNINNNTAIYTGLGAGAAANAGTPAPTGGVVCVTSWRDGTTNCVIRINGVKIGSASLAPSSATMNRFGIIQDKYSCNGMYLYCALAWTNTDFTAEQVAEIENWTKTIWSW